jgi:hypothetical protein
MQFLDVATVACLQSEGKTFKKAKERTGDSVSLRKETLKNNRKEARF